MTSIPGPHEMKSR